MSRYVEAGRHFDPATAMATPTEVIVPFTYACNVEPTGYDDEFVFRLSKLSEMSIDAACQIWRAHDGQPSIAIAGEHTFGKKLPSTAQMMKQWAVETGVDKDKLQLIRGRSGTSINSTPRQVKALKEKDKHGGLTTRLPITAVTMGYHAQRVRTHARAFGLQLNTVSAEEIVGPEDYPEIEVLGEFARRERHVDRLSFISPKGGVLNLLMMAQGPRLHDVIEDESGRYQALITTTRKHRRVAGYMLHQITSPEFDSNELAA